MKAHLGYGNAVSGSVSLSGSRRGVPLLSRVPVPRAAVRRSMAVRAVVENRAPPSPRSPAADGDNTSGDGEAAEAAGCPFHTMDNNVDFESRAGFGDLTSKEVETVEAVPIPGPRPLPLDYWENTFQVLKIPVYGIEEACLRFHQSYGKICRFNNFGVGWTFVTDPEIVEHICSRNSKNYMERYLPDVYSYITEGKGILGSSGKYNMKHRAMCKPPFQRTNILKDFAGIASTKARHMVDSWGMAEGGEVIVDAATDMQRLTLDVVGLVAFSYDFGGCDQTRAEVTGTGGGREANRLMGAVNESMEMIGRVFLTPEPLLRAMDKVGEPNVRKMNASLKEMRDLVEPVIQERRRALKAGEEVPADLMTALLEAQEGGEKFTDDELWEDVHDVMGAGHETTANTLTCALWEVAANRGVDERVAEELDRVLGGRLPTFEDYPELVYTTQVVKETLRLYPSIPLFPRKVAEDDVVPGGHVIPAGDVVFMSSYSMGRSAALWDEPYEFRPERFGPEEEKARHSFSWVPFGAGPRMCMGANFAMMSTTLILATLLQEYRLEAVTPTERSTRQGNIPFLGAWRGGMPFEYDMTLNFPTGVNLRAVRR